jgi:uncharacterized protein YjbI with pentapeptide repeats
MARHIRAFALICLFGAAPALGSPADCERQQLHAATQNEVDAAAASHRLWLDTENTSQVHGAMAELSWANLEGLSLVGKDLTRANLVGARLDRAPVDSGTLFTESDLTCAQLRRLQGPVANSTASQANFFQAKLNDADLSSANLPAAKFVGASMGGTNLNNAELSKADFARATLAGATFVNSVVEGAVFSGADLTDVVWQPQGKPPDTATMGSVTGLATLKLADDQPNSVPMGTLLKALRDARNDIRADEVAHALAVAETKVLSADGNWFAASFRTAFFGWGSNYGLDRTRPWLILLSFNLLFFPVYFALGFRLHATRLVRQPGEQSLASVRLRERLALTALFWLRTTIAAGVDKVNLPELLGRLVPAVNTVQAKGRLSYVSNVQSTVSALLILYAGYLTLFRPLG